VSKTLTTASSSSNENSGSGFTKRQTNKSIVFIGASGLVLAIGLPSSTSAFATSEVDCIDRTITPSESASDNVISISEKLNDQIGIVCLNGDFVIDNTILFDRDVKVYGIGNSSIEAPQSGVFLSNSSAGESLYEIEIENLTVKNSQRRAVEGLNVTVESSKFTGNQQGAIFAYGYVAVSNSTFLNNSEPYGGAAIRAEGVNEFGWGEEAEYTVNISNSTFEGNRATNEGGAVLGYSVKVENSTFVENEALKGGAIFAYGVEVVNSTFLENVATTDTPDDVAEGGAINSIFGRVAFNTFVNNRAPKPSPGEDIPGDAIFKSSDGDFLIGANIFAGNSDSPQLGYGDLEPSPFEDLGGNVFFEDLGGNVFSTLSATETDVFQHEESVFGASIASIFGTTTPLLATYEPNANGTQTIALASGSPALDVVSFTDPAAEVMFDQRGVARTNPADAGAFEGVAPITPTQTPNPSQTPAAVLATTGFGSPLLPIMASVLFLALGSLFTVTVSQFRRRRL